MPYRTRCTGGDIWLTRAPCALARVWRGQPLQSADPASRRAQATGSSGWGSEIGISHIVIASQVPVDGGAGNAEGFAIWVLRRVLDAIPAGPPSPAARLIILRL